MSDTTAIIIAVVGLVSSLGGAVLVLLRGRRSDEDTNALTERRDGLAERDSTIKDLRAELQRAVERIDLVDAHAENRVRDAEARAADRIQAVEKEQERSKRREHVRDDYINDLRKHIEDEKGPPAPPWPSTLYDF
jgi:chromosome segregation ATPase